MKKIIIIGGTAAGMTFASKLSRSKNKPGHVVYEKRKYTSLGACGIPFFVGDHAKDKKQLVAVTNEKHIENGINVKVEHEVIKVDVNKKEVLVKDLRNNNEFTDKYDELFIGTGATPFVPPMDGIDLDNVFTSTTLEDAVALKKMATDKSIKDVVIIGAGFIGVELAENLIKYDKKIRIIELQDRPVANIFDKELTDKLEEEFKAQGVTFVSGEQVKEIVGSKKVEGIVTDKNKYKADAVIVAIGFRPNTYLFKDQLDLYPNGSIKINRKGQTSSKNVWAAGDCVSVYNSVLEKDAYIPLATTSRKMATIVFENLVESMDSEFNGALGTSGFRFKNVELFITGISEGRAKFEKLDYHAITVNANDCAGYSGEAMPMQLKLISNKKGILIGAQASGAKKSAAIRIAALSACITNKMHVKDIEQLDLFYTPPFSTATDIIHIAARILNKKI